jgi:hypothetical protein
MSRTADQLVDDYLDRLDTELRALPRARRREVVEEIAEHIAEARGDLADEDEAGIETLLDRVGDPADIAVDARERFGIRPKKTGPLEIGALVLLLVGGFLAGIGWLVGVVLLWVSEAWTTRDKLIGTLVVPGGLALPLFLFEIAVMSSIESCSGEVDRFGKTVYENCTGGPSDLWQAVQLVVFVALLVAPFVTTAYLSRRLRRQSVPSPA